MTEPIEIQAQHGATITVEPGDPSAAIITVVDEDGTDAMVCLNIGQRAQLVSALLGTYEEMEMGS